MAVILLIVSIVGTCVALSSLTVSVLVMRKGSNQVGREFDDKVQLAVSKFAEAVDTKQSERFDQKLELALQRFGNILDDKFSQRMEVFVEEATMRLELAVLQTKLEKEVIRIDGTLGQLDHRLRRNTEHIAMLFERALVIPRAERARESET